MRDFIKKYFHLNSSAVYNSSAKNKETLHRVIGTGTSNRDFRLKQSPPA